MSMTREEAIAVLAESKRQNEVMRDNPSTFWASHQMADGVKNAERRIAALDMALSALRPVSREQVEEAWRGEWVPAESDFDDDDTLFDVEDWCDWQCSACHNEICYDDPMERKWLPKFCPNCGAPMTDKAVEIVMERMEALEDGKGD